MPFMLREITFYIGLSNKQFLVNHPFLLVNLSRASQILVQIILKIQAIFPCKPLYAAFESNESFFQRLCFYSIPSISRREQTSFSP